MSIFHIHMWNREVFLRCGYYVETIRRVHMRNYMKFFKIFEGTVIPFSFSSWLERYAEFLPWANPWHSWSNNFSLFDRFYHSRWNGRAYVFIEIYIKREANQTFPKENSFMWGKRDALQWTDAVVTAGQTFWKDAVRGVFPLFKCRVSKEKKKNGPVFPTSHCSIAGE